MSLVFEFNAAARGFHVYRDVWRPIEGEIRRCLFEDIFAIKVVTLVLLSIICQGKYLDQQNF